MKRLFYAAVIACLPGFTQAAPLKIVNVAAPAINCVFSTSCSVRVKDTKDDFDLSNGGEGILRTRTFKGASGSPAEGLFAYEYRLDLTDAVGTKPSCIDWISLSFGPVVSTLDFGGTARPDDVFVITSGGTGSIGLASAVQTRDTIRFRFKSPVCSGTSAAKGASTYFWGLVSTSDPENITALIHETGGATRVVKTRSPM
ncbi:MAG: hypothetical protein WAM70_21880 [Pyrinomonadaceae bacterium]